MVKIIGPALILLITTGGFAQSNILDQYIIEGLQNNLALKQQDFSFLKSESALDEARGMFFPSVDFLARYTRAYGGRTIIIPVNQFVSPLYNSLNDLLENLGLGRTDFPPLPDQEIRFLRQQEHETKLRLIQPVFQPAIYHNYNLKKDMRDIQKLTSIVFQRDLIRDIKQAYYNYVQALYAVRIFKESHELVQENLRVNERLFDAQKVTRDVVYRAQAELSSVEQQELEVQNRQVQARSYFNFLLNRSLDQEIIFDEAVLNLDISDFTFEEARAYGLNHREELEQLKTGIDAADNAKKINKSAYYPGLSAVVDYGYQGEQYDFDKEHDFWTASLVLDWNLFNGMQDKARVEQAILEKQRLSSQLDELNKQIELQIRQSYDNFIAARKKTEVAEKRRLSARSSFNLMEKKYQQGAASLVEFLDARSNLTSAEVSRLIAYYEYYANYAELERVTAYYQLPEQINEE